MLKNVNKAFGKKSILENITFDFENKTALVGLNGVGKTTLMRILIGLDTEFSGEVKIIKNASVVFSENILPEYITIKELCQSQNLNLDNMDKYLEMFSVTQYKNTLIKNLSLGSSKKMNIIFALLIEKEYLIMDEPTNGLDYQSIYNLSKILKEDKRILLLISHDFNFIKNVCDKIAILYEKKLLENLKINDLLQKYKKTDIESVFNYLVDRNEK